MMVSEDLITWIYYPIYHVWYNAFYWADVADDPILHNQSCIKEVYVSETKILLFTKIINRFTEVFDGFVNFKYFCKLNMLFMLQILLAKLYRHAFLFYGDNIECLYPETKVADEIRFPHI